LKEELECLAEEKEKEKKYLLIKEKRD